MFGKHEGSQEIILQRDEALTGIKQQACKCNQRARGMGTGVCLPKFTGDGDICGTDMRPECQSLRRRLKLVHLGER